MTFQEIIEIAASVIEGAGVAIILLGAAWSSVVAILHALRREPLVYKQYRRMLGQSILLGLEFLVAADIVRTVAVTPTLESVAVLAAIILIRTFLSLSLELEITGRWPWQSGKATDPVSAAD
ncbi:DUF1622 domain-containing protein [Subtercola frigoramans]|uniref:Membrane protein n=1 Tax=Subtercola frigoramans TaxID=120298 RepID=A0ABS2L2J0_9MICO|nr:DUF1622 domain-containing protein [Subtercola frigoramans]MBM7471277.1 putative membrane protein [Subtercola frigoramans]